MNILIVGGGSVGSAICAQLTREDHNITIIDESAAAVAEIADSCDVFGVVGNGADISILRKAHADKADLLIAVSAMDEINILCCAAARQLGTKHTVARVRNPEYSELMELLQSEMNLSFTINPELAAAAEISRLLRFPSATKINTFCGGKVELAEFVISESSPFCGVSLYDMRQRLNIKFLVCGVLRGGEAHIPTGHFVIEAGDTVCITTSDRELTKLFKALGIYKTPIKNVLIAGGGRTTYYLLSHLAAAKISATVIEKNRELCRDLAADYADATIICDNCTHQEALLEAGLESTDAFLALSGVDEENAIASMYAKTLNLRKIVTMISRLSYVDFFKSAGLESIVSPKSSTAANILRYVRSLAKTKDSDIEALYKILDDRVEALQLSVNEEIEGVTGIALKALRLRRDVLIACIVRDGEIIIPTGDTVIAKGDTVIVITTGERTSGIRDIV
ncbi:MAG: Trk system potassium transporter TrkA [Clostridia bacterium]|nr:Trk system potassium transporter TrkA [Clostridia bacterium]